jgi:hypothetical protein
MATRQSRLKHWIQFAGMTVSAGVRMAVMEQPLRVRPPTVRDGIHPYYGFRSRRLDRLLHRRERPTPFPNWISTP